MSININTVRPGHDLVIDLSAWIDVLAPSGMCGCQMDGPTTRDLIAILVACRAELGGAPVIVDLTTSDYTIGGGF